MGEIPVRTWGEFEALAVEKVERMVALPAGRRLFTPQVLFRGQADARWGLTTTLQRAIGRSEEKVVDYHIQMKVVHDSITSLLGKHWDTETCLNLAGFEVQGIEFMAYLRQNGYPSPLLDWTASPYIAAYFAFRDTQNGTTRPEHVAIYTYEELPDEDERIQFRFQSAATASIRTIGPCLATDRKHHLQQCQYTLCMCKGEEDCCYAAYPDDIVTCDTRRCVVEKYVIPMTEQEKVLRRLQMMNVTAYSLFGTEAALMESLAMREVFLGGR